MLVRFTDDAKERDVSGILHALQKHSPARISDKEGEPMLVITKTGDTVNLIGELTKANIPIGITPGFASTPRFEEVLVMHGIKWRNPTSQGQAR